MPVSPPPPSSGSFLPSCRSRPPSSCWSVSFGCSPPSSAAPPSPFWLLVRTAGPLACVSGKLGVVSWGPCPASDTLSLQWGSLFPPPLPHRRIPAPPSPEHEWAACVASGSPWGTAPSQRPQHGVSAHFVHRLGSGRLKGHFSFDLGPQSSWSRTTPGVGEAVTYAPGTGCCLLEPPFKLDVWEGLTFSMPLSLCMEKGSRDCRSRWGDSLQAGRPHLEAWDGRVSAGLF